MLYWNPCVISTEIIWRYYYMGIYPWSMHLGCHPIIVHNVHVFGLQICRVFLRLRLPISLLLNVETAFCFCPDDIYWSLNPIGLHLVQIGLISRINIFFGSKNSSNRLFISTGHLSQIISEPIKTQISCKFLVITTLLISSPPPTNPLVDMSFLSDRYKVTILKNCIPCPTKIS